MPTKEGAVIHNDVDKAKELLAQLDYHKYTKFDAKKIESIKKELAQLRASAAARHKEDAQETSGYIPYPELTDPDFHKKIYSKKEFQKNLYAPVDKSKSFDELASEKCSANYFRLSKNQVFVKNFLSPHTPYNGMLLFHGVGVGKCHAKDTPIIMYDGTIKPVQEVQQGDLVMGDDSTPRNVLNTITGQDQMYKITPIKGDPYTVNSEHILCLRYTGKGAIEKVERKGTMWYKAMHLDNKTLGMISKHFSTHDEANAFLESFSPADKIVHVPVKRYLNLSKKLQKNLKGYRAAATTFPTPPTPQTIQPYNLGQAISSKSPSSNPVFNKNGKHIPHHYRCASKEVRLEVLAGLIDEDGYSIHNCYKVICRSERLVKDVMFVSRSLGFAAYSTRLQQKPNENQRVWYIHISGSGLHEVPVKKADKKIGERQQIKDALVTGITVTEAEQGEYYGFMTDNNHCYLLGDFTVTHNSCSAISIAEQFRDTLDNKIMLLAPTSIKENFRKQIYDVNKVQQCTGTKYLQQVPDRHIINKQTLEKRIHKIINNNYQIMGFQEFARSIIKLKEIYKEKSESRYISKIREMYSNRVIIVDEVHNVRKGDKDSKLVPPCLMDVLEYAENIKLVLLTATPMFNEASEMVWLLNLLLANDKRPQIATRDIFDQNKMLTAEGKRILAKASRGYVSYMRGENPFSFPFKLNPSANKDKHILKKPPSFDIKGEEIPKEMRLQQLELIESPMEEYQRAVYEEAEAQQQHDEQKEDEDDNDEEAEEQVAEEAAAAEGRTINTKLVQISNVVFPTMFDNPEYKECYGKQGLYNCFNNVQNDKKRFKITYKPDIKAEYGEFLSEETLSEYAPKIKRILEYIKNSKGIVFVYSFYKIAGLIPLAIALEHAGFNKYNNNNIMQKISKRDPFMVNGKQATYSILTPDSPYTPDFNGEIDIIRSEANKDGEVVKVILGTSVSSEGLDFKNIREIHLMEPWYHLNKVSQIVGRAIRNCSHMALPPKDRNVTVYYHTCSIPSRKNETIDLRMYRIAENKQSSIDAVELVLKQNSIDCALNKNALYFNPNYLGMKLDIVTSQGKVIKNFAVGDHTASGYKEYKCAYEPSSAKKPDESTFDKAFYIDDMDMYASYVSLAYKVAHAFTYKQLSSMMKEEYKLVDEDILKFTLEYMINTKYIVKNHKNQEGFMIYRDQRYMFQPADTVDMRLTNKARADYERIHQRQLLLDKRVVDANKHMVNKEQDIVGAIEMVQERVDAVVKSDFDLPVELLQHIIQQVYDYIIDRLEQKQLMSLCLHVMDNETPEKHVVHIQKSLQGAHILVKETPSSTTYRWARDIYSNNTVFVKKNEELVEASPNELQKFTASGANKVKAGVKFTDLKGFMELVTDKKGTTSKFKMIDSSKKKADGSVCSITATFYKDDLKKSIKAIERGWPIDEHSKTKLCNLYEVLLRATKPKCFTRCYETMLVRAVARAKN